MHLFRAACRHFSRAAVSLPVFAVLAVASGCVNGVEGPGIDDTGSISLAVSNQNASIAVGMPAVSAVTVTRKDGYTGTVLLGADSLPAGVTVTFEPSALGGAATTSIMTITAAATAAVVIDTINVRASGVNVTTDSVKVEVRISTGSITLASPAMAVTATQGGSASLPLTIARINGFAASVNLLAEGLPANVTATFTPALLPNGTEGSTLVLSATAGAAIGTTTVTVRARGQGVPDKTIPVLLNVISSATPGFTLRMSPAVVRLVAGGNAQSVLNVARTGGFTGDVTFAHSGLPVGVTGTFAPNPTTSGISAVTLTATAAALPGTYIMTITGSAGGAPGRVVHLVVTVTPIPGVKVVVAPATLSIAKGGFAQAAVLLTRVAGFTGDFVMSAEGLPAGLTASFAPAPVIGTATTLTLAATAATTAGTYNIVIKATAGSEFGTFTVPVTVATTALRQ